MADCQNRFIASYSDDSKTDALSAVYAREKLVKRYGQEVFFPVYLIKPEAPVHELGESHDGIITVRSIREK